MIKYVCEVLVMLCMNSINNIEQSALYILIFAVYFHI